MRKSALTAVAAMLLPFVILAQSAPTKKPQTLRSIRQAYLNQNVVLSGPVSVLSGKRVLLYWTYAKESHGRYDADGFQNHLPEDFHGKIGRVIAIQMNKLHTTSGGTNALGETVPEDDLADPYFDLVAQLDDGKLGMVTTYFGLLNLSVVLESEHSKRVTEMNSQLPLVVGKPLYAVAYSHLYEPDSTLEQMTGRQAVLKQLSASAAQFLTPLPITAAKYFESCDCVVLKLKLPDGQDALTVTLSEYLDTSDGAELPFLSRIAGTLLTEVPHKLTAREIDAIKRVTIIKGMSENGVYYAIGFAEKKNDWGDGGMQMIFFGGKLIVYLDKQGSVVDWQSFDK
jgi:hypothetical protein